MTPGRRGAPAGGHGGGCGIGGGVVRLWWLKYGERVSVVKTYSDDDDTTATETIKQKMSRYLPNHKSFFLLSSTLSFTPSTHTTTTILATTTANTTTATTTIPAD